MIWEYCDISGAVSRATNLLDLTIEYRDAPDKVNDQRTGLPRTELETTLQQLKTEGWQLESQCANPTPEWYTETYTFKRARQTEG
jgi:hypothetical protein